MHNTQTKKSIRAMFAQHLRFASRLGAAGVGAAVLSSKHIEGNSSTRCDAVGQQQLRRTTPPQQRLVFDHALDDREKDTAGFVGVFLDAASVARVQNAVGGPLSRNAHALIQLHPEPELKRSFAPLFGTKVCVCQGGAKASGGIAGRSVIHLPSSEALTCILHKDTSLCQLPLGPLTTLTSPLCLFLV